ncbi:MAG: hypothetical protein EOP81_01450 [Variovorax sp.]|nr:MAG: hypothetical protein EOP81_01450 [Variovorax sp.]
MDTLPRRGLSRLWSRVLRILGGVGIGITVSAAPALAQTPARPQAQPAQPVPQHWISYAQLVGNQLQDRLGDAQSEAVVRLHGWMQERILKEGQAVPPAPLVVRLWIAADGGVSRLEFSTLGQAQADADLRAVLATEPLSESPPRDMRQPMVLQLSLAFAAAT